MASRYETGMDLHGHRRSEEHGGRPSPTYVSWKKMKQRCGNPNDDSYENYGGRGIKVCDRWGDFRAFLEDMGERPKGTTLDRIDPDGDYEPGNCRWADSDVQRLNQANSGVWTDEEERFIRDNWRDMSDGQIAEELGRTPRAVEARRLGLDLRRDA